MTIDTRLVNARLVDSSGVRHGSLSIDGGRLIADQETDDIWRTVDASGHLVFPGIIQPADPTGETALDWAKRGTTTAIVRVAPGDAENQDRASFDWFEVVDVATPNQMSRGLNHGAQTFSPRGFPMGDLPDLDGPAILRLGPGSGNVIDWLDVENVTLIVSADLPGAVELAGHECVVVEIAGPSLLTDTSGQLWDLVGGESRVLVTSGGDPRFPLLHFIYHEGYVNRSIPLARIAGLVSLGAAEAYGLAQKAGFDKGNDGDLVVFDPDTDDPYLDSSWPGRVIFSLQRGNILLYNGQLHTAPGDGRQVGQL